MYVYCHYCVLCSVLKLHGYTKVAEKVQQAAVYSIIYTEN